MKKILLFFIAIIFLALPSILKAQCYGTIVYDQSSNANGNSTFNINTTYANELILITYNGWPNPGAGPVTVDGNPATHINTAHVSNSAVAEAYCYNAPTAGTHTIVCTETNYSSPYYLNMAAAFYVTGSCTPLSCDSTTNNETSIGFGTSLSTTITTSVPGEMIYGSFVYNTGIFNPFAMTVTGPSFTETLHEGDGIDAAEGYETAPTAGTYTVTTNDINSCCGGGTVLIAIIPPHCSAGGMLVNATDSNPSCNNNTGYINLNVTGGTSPYTYTWTPNISTTNIATGLSAGTYSIDVQDAGCSDTTIVITLTGVKITPTANITANELCNGNCTGSANVTVLGGLTPYTYSWAPVGGSTFSAIGLCAGVYTVTVSDANGCTGTVLATITQPAPVKGTPVINNVLCNGGVGSATITGSGGRSPYTYSWAPGGQTTATATSLTAGTYTVNMTDINGCTGSVLVNVTQPAPLVAAINNPTYPICNGGNGGAATGSASGGVSPYTYAWSPGSQTNATATGLIAGTYTLTVKDKNGCTATTSIVITQPNVVSGNITIITTPPCNGGVGSASIAGTGGTPGYNYVWAPTGQTTATATGLTAGIYTITVKDVNGCTGTVTATLTQPNTLTVSATYTHASCGLPNGSATANAVGGTVPYTYAWTPGGQTNMTAVNLLAGPYTVTVTDKDHCTASTTVTITQPSAVTATITASTNIDCNGRNDGSATVTAGGGTAPYAYSWSPGGGSNANAAGLSAGTYVVTVKDANGCTVTASTILTQPAALSVTISGPQIRCLGDKGNFTANVSGGTGPYQYNWIGPGVSPNNAATVSIQPPGTQTYTVTVTDAHGCTANGYLSFSFPPPLAVTTNGTAVTCSGRSATLCALATGGTGGDTYLWEPVNLSSPCVTIPVSANTVYTVTVTDNCSVTATASTMIHVNPPPAVNFTSNAIQGCEPLCVQFRNLTASTGGKEEYIWNFGNGDSLLEENPIFCYTSNGVFNVTLTVISDSGCSSTLSKIGMITVYNRPVASFTYSPQQVTILSPTVEFTDKSNDLSGIIYRLWNFGDGRGDSSASNLQDPSHTYHDTGNYCASLIVMDAHGCTDTTTNCLVIAPQYNLYIPSAFTPNGDGIDDQFKPVGQYIKSFDMYIFDRWGLQLYHTTDINKGWNGSVNGSGSTAQEDTYIYKITVTDAQDNQHSYIGNVTLIK